MCWQGSALTLKACSLQFSFHRLLLILSKYQFAVCIDVVSCNRTWYLVIGSDPRFNRQTSLCFALSSFQNYRGSVLPRKKKKKKKKVKKHIYVYRRVWYWLYRYVLYDKLGITNIERHFIVTVFFCLSKWEDCVYIQSSFVACASCLCFQLFWYLGLLNH